jgi:hypothetical protein
LGSIAAVGEISCLVAAVVVLPAVYEARAILSATVRGLEGAPARNSLAPPG